MTENSLFNDLEAWQAGRADRTEAENAQAWQQNVLAANAARIRRLMTNPRPAQELPMTDKTTVIITEFSQQADNVMDQSGNQQQNASNKMPTNGVNKTSDSETLAHAKIALRHCSQPSDVEKAQMRHETDHPEATQQRIVDELRHYKF